MLQQNDENLGSYNAYIARLVHEAGGVGKMIGARVLIKEVPPVDEVSARAKNAGLHVVVYDRNVPKPTEGIVIGVGGDPLLQEEVQVGDHVFFGKFAGHMVYEEGKEWRSLEFQEITRVKPRSYYGWEEQREAQREAGLPSLQEPSPGGKIDRERDS